jgi:hypothetical protein
MYFVYNTEQEALTDIAKVNTGFFAPRPNGEYITDNYCLPVECNEGWAVIADEVTMKYIQGVPQEITFNTPEI